MAKIWYTAMKIEREIASIGLVRAGTLFTAEKAAWGGVKLTELYAPHRTITISADLARTLFLAPTTDANDAHEQAIMLCEAAYC